MDVDPKLISETHLPKVWKQLQEGREEALRQLYHAFRDELFQYGRRLVRNDDLVVNAIQDLYVRLWQLRQNLGEARSVKAYLFSSLRRSLLAEVKKSRRYSLGIEEAEELETFAGFSPEDIVISDEQTRLKNDMVAALLNTLTDRQREIVYLKYYNDLSIQEIAALLEINYQSVINHLQRALLKLRQAIPPQKLAAITLALGLVLLSSLF